MQTNAKTELVVLGGGCFWCTEAVFNSLRGIVLVVPGYAGGQIEDPTYEEVSLGNTGHIEVTRIEFDPVQITFKDLLTIFFATHDPTTIDRQGNDVGPQYRSVIFYTTQEQLDQSREYITSIENMFTNPIVTELRPFDRFYKAEDYHVRYYERHKDAPYCQAIIDPKLEKLQKQFADLLKTHTQRP